MHVLVQIRHVSSNFLPFWFLVSGKPTAWHFNSLLTPGDQMKKLWDVTAAYTLYRCKHLSMLIFCVVSPPLIFCVVPPEYFV